MPKATLTSKGQITVPKAIRDSLNLKPGDQLLFLPDDGGAYIRPMAKRSVGELFGVLRGIAPYDREAERAAAQAQAVREALNLDEETE
ncbi:MAG TPA: AbrB/MazE/SpoVT family DNA-binding domain-containing protein [Chloroflexota bacterium]|nr:AbrB/MazE/SpoVT family DNA-binding domain-containing protein [Chloroflexota bacterium]